MNHLAQESSPYLLQHKNNLVNWYPWGAEALQRAADEDKVIILSNAYSACHLPVKTAQEAIKLLK
ncbi:Domain of unknown function DUF255 [Spirosomataceae bacterium]|jgi:uncharacterized protein YyaL (SSP411 family)